MLKKALTYKKLYFGKHPMIRFYKKHNLASKLFLFNSLSAKSILAGEKLVATYSIST